MVGTILSTLYGTGLGTRFGGRGVDGPSVGAGLGAAVVGGGDILTVGSPVVTISDAY